MSNRRFIELSSSTRNRNQYPNPADFDVPFSPPRSLNKSINVFGTYGTPSSTIYNQQMDVADTITTGIIDYYWTSGTSSFYSIITTSGIISTLSSTSTFYLSGLGIQPTNSFVNDSLLVNGAYAGMISSSLNVCEISITNSLLPYSPVAGTSCVIYDTFNTTNGIINGISTTTTFYVNAAIPLPIPNFTGYLFAIGPNIAGTITTFTNTSGNNWTFTIGTSSIYIPPSIGTSIGIFRPITSGIIQPNCSTSVFYVSGITQQALNFYNGEGFSVGTDIAGNISSYIPTITEISVQTPLLVLSPSPGSTTSIATMNATIMAAPVSTTTSFYVAGLTSTIINFYVGYNFYVNGVLAGVVNSYTPSSGLITVVIPLLSAAPTAGQVVSFSDPSTSTSITLPYIDQTGKSLLIYDQAYNGDYIMNETTSTGSTIVSSIVTSYNPITRVITLASPLAGFVSGTTVLTLRKTLPSQKWQTVASSAIPTPTNIVLGSNVIYLPAGASSTDNAYNGMYIYLYPSAGVQTSPLTNIEGSCFYINSYIGQNRACVVTSINPTVPGATAFYPSYSSQPASIPAVGTFINIVVFSNDNFTPLLYNGSVVSQSESVAYEISLINLILPNITITNGSRTAFYPYVYVEFTNTGSPSTSSKQIIYSNNPNSYKALFLVPITDLSDPLRTPFIKLDAGGMTQTVKFKPNDNLHFSVFLPNGKLFQTVMSDYYSPSAPNPLVQIDAVFGIRRVA